MKPWIYTLMNIKSSNQINELISTGIAMAIPQGNVGLIGIVLAWPLIMVSKAWVGIDSNYREIKVILHNLTTHLSVEKACVIAQMLIQKVEQKEILK